MANLDGRERAAYVQVMFDRIAHRYDLMNRVMTFGQDGRWRHYLVRQANLPDDGRLLDVATGTGDIMLEARKQVPSVTAVGVDFALGMMFVGQGRRKADGVGWCGGDAYRLPFNDATFDAVSSGYLLRNVTDVLAVLREQVRVVKPGGAVLSLDTSPPPENILRPFILFHLRFIIPLLGRIIAGDSAAYNYLPESTEKFKTPDELADLMRQAGLENVRYKRFMFGTMAVHVGTRPE